MEISTIFRFFSTHSIIVFSTLFFCFSVLASADVAVSGNKISYELFCRIFSFYTPLFHLLILFILWGVSLYMYPKSDIPYSDVFRLGNDHLQHKHIWKCCGGIFGVTVLVLAAHLVVAALGNTRLADSIAPVILYGIILAVLLFPAKYLRWSSRKDFLKTLCFIPWHILAFKEEHEAFFWEICLTDIFVSTPKVLSDFVCSVHRLIYRWGHAATSSLHTHADSICGSGYIEVAGVQFLPFMVRFLQCLKKYNITKEFKHLVNALKFLTALFVISLPVLQKHLPHLRYLWFLLCLLNTLLMIIWDMYEDWGLRFTKKLGFGDEDHYLIGYGWFLYWVIFTNIIFRFMWIYQYIGQDFQRDHPVWFTSIVFGVTALEIFRRFQWFLFRMRNEWIKIQATRGAQ